MKRRILAAVLCCLLLLCGSVVVAGADSAASYVENITTITSDGECHVTLRVNIHLDAVTERLTFPVPLGATDIELNNRNAKTTRGIAGEEITSFYQRYYHMPQGLYITEVRPGGAADLGGLKAGDILISLEGVPVPNRDAVDRLVYSHRVGDTLVAVIYRSGTEIQVELTLTEEH